MIKIDATGKQCPIPMILAKRAIQEWREPDGILQITVDNEIAVQNLFKMANQLQQEAAFEKLSDHEYHITFKIKNKNPGFVTEQREEPLTTEIRMHPNTSFSIVAVSSETMGDGDKQLGAILMKGFFYALTQLDTLPQVVLFYNGGAKLTCKSSECLEDIRSLHDEGVEILTCGTCLDFYGLKEDLQVGTITNMYEIVEIQSQAVHIIRP